MAVKNLIFSTDLTEWALFKDYNAFYIYHRLMSEAAKSEHFGIVNIPLDDVQSLFSLSDELTKRCFEKLEEMGLIEITSVGIKVNECDYVKYGER